MSEISFLFILLLVLFVLTVSMGIYAWYCQRRMAQDRRILMIARQEATVAQEQAQAAVSDKSRFLGMLSHELLTPLQSVVSSMDMIEAKGTVSKTDPVFLRLRQGASALHARTSDLVDFAKMSAGKLMVSHRRFRLDKLIEDVIAEFEEEVIRKELAIHWDSSPLLAKMVVTDPRRVRQILNNLISNAVKYTQRGGVMIEAVIDHSIRKLTLEVRDTGVGIDESVLDHIFEPFYRVASATHFAQGSGLGLAVVHSLVELLQGNIRVESELGQGSVFTVCIPVALFASQNSYLSSALVSMGRVLIVDDAHDARTLLADNVRNLGYMIDEAGSAPEALRVLEQTRYAVILLDIELGIHNGFDVIQSVRIGSGLNRDSYFVMMSASHENNVATNLFNERADKPVNQEQLRLILEKKLGIPKAR
jgi:signal transduction histidine kinase/CheY-like chemotaxis protein